jgi:DnaJ-class molecular chaperone
MNWTGAKGKGEPVTCNACGGKGHTWIGLTRTTAVECKVCGGKGYVTVK